MYSRCAVHQNGDTAVSSVQTSSNSPVLEAKAPGWDRPALTVMLSHHLHVLNSLIACSAELGTFRHMILQLHLDRESKSIAEVD